MILLHLLTHVLLLSHPPAHPHPPPLQSFGYINDIKADVPRTAYKGVVMLRHKGCRKLLLPEQGMLP